MIYTLEWGTSPLLVSIPHCGTTIPVELRSAYTPRALRVEDTDWYLDELYAFAQAKGASFLTSQISRYVIDNNRPPESELMYENQNNTELCPTRHFSGEEIYLTPPTQEDVAYRKMKYWRQYHNCLKSELPWLFKGKLPDLNLGTANGESCSPFLLEKLASIAAASGYTYAVNGRFKGGYITRNYGKPADNIHAVQLEMCFSTYIQEQEPYLRDEVRIAKLTPVLEQFIDTMLGWKP